MALNSGKGYANFAIKTGDPSLSFRFVRGERNDGVLSKVGEFIAGAASYGVSKKGLLFESQNLSWHTCYPIRSNHKLRNIMMPNWIICTHAKTLLLFLNIRWISHLR